MKATDVLVIGAGPAGSVAAAMIHKSGFNVRVVEREKFPRFVIGESLLPRCMEVLEDAGMLEAVKAMKFQEKFGAKFVKEDAVSDFNFIDQFTKGWHWTWQVPRAEFDTVLANQVASRGVPIDYQTTVTDIQFHDDESSVTTLRLPDGSMDTVYARFIVDASGYGRVIPRLFKLDAPSSLEPRKAVFAHVQDGNRSGFEEPDRIIVVVYAPGTWVWVIPFSNGITSLGFVGDFEFFDSLLGDEKQKFATLIEGNGYTKARFGDQPWVFEPRKLEAWSSKTDSFHGKGYVLSGNVTEFLDPIFSSGVMFATVSSHIASQLVVRKLKGEEVDFVKDYKKVMDVGLDTYRSFVEAWYDGTLEKIFFTEKPDPKVQRQICSVLAGYVWDMNNPFVKSHENALQRIAKMIDLGIGT